MPHVPHSRTSAEDLQDKIPEVVTPKQDELLVDEAALESFPASDAPSWTPTHAGEPLPTIKEGTPREVRSRLRAAYEMLARTESSKQRADIVANALLEADRAVTRIPVKLGGRFENIEAIVPGVDKGAELVVGARYEGDPRSIAVLLGLARVLEGRRFVRGVRLVAFGDGPRGSRAYARYLREHDVAVRAMVTLEGLGSFAGARHGLYVLGNLRSRSLVGDTRDAFRVGSELPVRALAMPAFVPFVSSPDQRAFWRHRWPAALVTSASPRRRDHATAELDYDVTADIVFGLACVVARLAGGEGRH